MTNRTKTFDCVRMKDRVQKKLREEYEARKREFSSYVDFINRTAEESPEIRDYWAQVEKAKARPESQ